MLQELCWSLFQLPHPEQLPGAETFHGVGLSWNCNLGVTKKMKEGSTHESMHTRLHAHIDSCTQKKSSQVG